MSSPGDYVRHAERHGAEMVFETVTGLCWPYEPDLTVRQLGALSLQLQRLDPKWRLPKDEFPVGDHLYEVRHPRGLAGVDLALMLISEGVHERDACRMGMVSRSTISRRQRIAREVLRQAASRPDQGPQAAFQSGGFASNRGAEGDCLATPDLTLWEAV
jgi:hypothetical protein